MRGALGGPQRIVAPASRSDGGAGQRAGTPRQDRGSDCRQHGGGRCAPSTCCGSTPRLSSTPPRASTARPCTRPCCSSGRGPGRPGGERSQRHQPVGRAGAPGLLVPTRRPAKRVFTTPSWASRSCAPATPLGVLVVQNRARRTYSEEEVEALQTTAMVLAEMIASGEAFGCSPEPGAEPAVRRTLRLQGTAPSMTASRLRPRGAPRAARRHHQFHRRRRRQ